MFKKYGVAVLRYAENKNMHQSTYQIQYITESDTRHTAMYDSVLKTVLNNEQ